MKTRYTTDEWTGIRGKIGGWFLKSPIRRLLEILILGDCKSAFLEKISHMIIQGDEIMLDVGAGSGYFSLPLAKKLNSGKLICLDVSMDMLWHLKRYAKKEHLIDKIQIMNAEAISIGIKTGSIDFVISGGVFHEISSPETVLSEMFRVLRPEGWILIADFRDTWIGRRFGTHYQYGHGPFNVDELKSLFIKIGLRDVKANLIENWVIVAGKKCASVR
ncbi:class I SAM-dependent methyltransferase [Candidatus Bathyarchaeota archaeon]|nr:class I SAM-dependent methyltransferase [Candidatus Bathyarchaeota archaeon]